MPACTVCRSVSGGSLRNPARRHARAILLSCVRSWRCARQYARPPTAAARQKAPPSRMCLQVRMTKRGGPLPRARREEGATSGNGPPRLVIRTCKHILEGGAFCRAAAVGGRAYCRAHLQLRTQLGRMARAGRRAGFLKLPPLTDLQTVQAGMVKLQVALAGGHLDDGRARLLRYGLRQMAADFRFLEQWPASEQTRKSKQLYQIDISHYESNSYP